MIVRRSWKTATPGKFPAEAMYSCLRRAASTLKGRFLLSSRIPRVGAQAPPQSEQYASRQLRTPQNPASGAMPPSRGRINPAAGAENGNHPAQQLFFGDGWICGGKGIAARNQRGTAIANYAMRDEKRVAGKN